MSTDFILRPWPSPRTANLGSVASYVVMLNGSSASPSPPHDPSEKSAKSGDESQTYRTLFPFAAMTVPMGQFRVGPSQDDIAVYPGTPSPPDSASDPVSEPESSVDPLFEDAVEFDEQGLPPLPELDRELELLYPPTPVVASAQSTLPEDYAPNLEEEHMPTDLRSNSPMSVHHSPVVTPSPAPVPVVTPTSESSQNLLPDIFDGKEADVMPFLSQCYAFFAAHPRELRSDDDKVTFILSRFRGVPRTIYERPNTAKLDWHGNFSAFISEFLQIFYTPDYLSDAEDQLRLLRMKPSEEIAPFLREFEDLLARLGWSESAKCHALHHALPLRLSLELDDCTCYPSTYAGLRAMVTRLDSKYWATQPEAALAEARRNARLFWGDYDPTPNSPGDEDYHGTPSGNDLLDRGTPGPRAASPALSDISSGMPSLTSLPVFHIASDSGSPIPANTRAVRPGEAGPSSGYVRTAVDPSRKRTAEVAGLLNNKGKLRKEEADRRKRLGLCMYCGSSNHHVETCNRISRVVSDKRQRTGEDFSVVVD